MALGGREGRGRRGKEEGGREGGLNDEKKKNVSTRKFLSYSVRRTFFKFIKVTVCVVTIILLVLIITNQTETSNI